MGAVLVLGNHGARIFAPVRVRNPLLGFFANDTPSVWRTAQKEDIGPIALQIPFVPLHVPPLHDELTARSDAARWRFLSSGESFTDARPTMHRSFIPAASRIRPITSRGGATTAPPRKSELSSKRRGTAAAHTSSARQQVPRRLPLSSDILGGAVVRASHPCCISSRISSVTVPGPPSS